jgi:catechol 2,3-dioxygenase-like lactoylglutathione lyase family enzyme
LISSDTWPAGAALGLTRAEINEAKTKGVQPSREKGFAYLKGPDGAIVEYLGNFPAERMNHVHMFQDHPFCAELWYRKHLNAQPVAGRAAPPAMTEANCQVPRGPDPSWPAMEREGLYRTPRAAVEFDDVMLTWYARQGDAALVGTRGHLYDHVALSVADLDAWMDKLRREGVTFLEQPYRLGDTHAAMIEGPSREAIELVEIK